MIEKDYEVLTREEVRRIIEAGQNPKNRLILILAYSAGLGINEIEDLRTEDIDFKGNVIHIKAAKRAERVVSLSKSILELLKPYIEIYRPSPWLFPGPSGPDSVSKITGEAIENIFRSAMLKAGIMKESGIQILRRSITAHLHESGASAEEIKKLLGRE